MNQEINKSLEPDAPNNSYIQGKNAFKKLRIGIKDGELVDMSLNMINEEINAARQESANL